MPKKTSLVYMLWTLTNIATVFYLYLLSWIPFSFSSPKLQKKINKTFHSQLHDWMRTGTTKPQWPWTTLLRGFVHWTSITDVSVLTVISPEAGSDSQGNKPSDSYYFLWAAPSSDKTRAVFWFRALETDATEIGIFLTKAGHIAIVYPHFVIEIMFWT